MRLRRKAVETYAERIFTKLWHSGVDFDPFPGAPTIDSAGAIRLVFDGRLPDAGLPQPARLAVHEWWSPVAGKYWERTGYAYDLIDYANSFRRAFHWHDGEYFVRRFRVVVHQHWEARIGRAPCPHYECSPVADAFRGIEILLSIWQMGSAGCHALHCLDQS